MYTDKHFSPSPDHKLKGLEHVLYEIEMFTELPASSAYPLVSNCLTEAFLIHTRVLCDFFQKPRIKDDIISDDYGFPQSSLGISSDIETRFDKCLAHVTYSRICFKDEDDTKRWLLTHFRPRLILRIREFLEHLITSNDLKISEKDIGQATLLLQKIKYLTRSSTAKPPHGVTDD